MHNHAACVCKRSYKPKKVYEDIETNLLWIVKCPALRATFVGKYPVPRSYYDGQMSGFPVHQTNTQK